MDIGEIYTVEEVSNFKLYNFPPNLLRYPDLAFYVKNSFS